MAQAGYGTRLAHKALPHIGPAGKTLRQDLDWRLHGQGACHGPYRPRPFRLRQGETEFPMGRGANQGRGSWLHLPPAGARRRSSSKKFSSKVTCVGFFWFDSSVKATARRLPSGAAAKKLIPFLATHSRGLPGQDAAKTCILRKGIDADNDAHQVDVSGDLCRGVYFGRYIERNRVAWNPS